MTPNVSSSAASSWLPRTSASHTWLSTDLLTSAPAIPLYLILALYLLSHVPWLLERFCTPASTRSTAAYVVPAVTRHARFLPTTSRHAFRYNTLYLALRLDRLETRALDTRHAFAWKGRALQPEFVDEAALASTRGVTPAGAGGGADATEGWKARMRAAERIERKRLEEKRGRNERMTWSLTGLRPEGYLRTHVPVEGSKGEWIGGSVLLKLAYELRARGFLDVGPQDSDMHPGATDWRHELGHVWTVTMPSIAGITGINPLTIHYCYRPHGLPTPTQDDDARGAFWLVVLEVHNTFSERHIYVLQAGTDEDADATSKRTGYDHQWTFARSFHVSPFNDRGGFYRLMLKEPFGTQQQEGDAFVLGIRLLLLVESPDADSPTLVKKLMATLDSVSPPPASAKTPATPTGRCVRPLSSATLYAALMRQPADLFLTFVRILYEAAKLHFAKRLDAFGRPDMVQVSEPASAHAFDGEGLPPALNRIQPHRSGAEGAHSGDGGLVYPEPGWAEVVAKEYVKAVLQRRVDELRGMGERWTVHVESTDPAEPGLSIGEHGEGGRKLVLHTRSYGVYVDLMTYTPPRLALLLGSVVSRRWGVSSLDAFDAFFSNPLTANTGIRQRHFEHLLSSASLDRTQATELLRAYGVAMSSASGTVAESCKVRLALWTGYVAAVAEKRVFAWLGARYVAGTEPWLELQRGLEYVRMRGSGGKEEVGWDTRLGSVYRASSA
ncbi:uncharacterized protein SRS1_15043 [Sporisorium reilianum f. sp. reilianum]|uniref:Uncharacterized protein n=1 Tax=Sporisorium reilianum f. sp. reilianum TaxID=72559 RepID=A0A2N8UI67_9BASI|nr:uncharacterized protein SRS1_15043 [Sporisorium reilianum f. sp. reilianum]